jgi:glycogen synthase kinase 3 beta
VSVKPPAYNIQVFRKASHDSIDLISALLEYTPTQRLSAIDAMVQPFFDELRDPSTRLPDSRHSNGPPRELPNLFDFSRHGSFACPPGVFEHDTNPKIELSIAPHLNSKLVPPHARAALVARGLDIDNFTPLTKDEMMARLD